MRPGVAHQALIHVDHAQTSENQNQTGNMKNDRCSDFRVGSMKLVVNVLYAPLQLFHYNGAFLLLEPNC